MEDPNQHSAKNQLTRARGNLAAAVGTGVLAMLVLAVWAFPALWYTRASAKEATIWFRGNTNVAGWVCRQIPIGASAERLLVADHTFNAEFTNQTQNQVVSAFLAKRYTHKPHDTGLFLHTPDRCWTLGGWKIEPITPDHVEVNVHGAKLVFERRVFVAGGARELVYFGGLVGGHALPYRLDHNLSVGMRFAATEVRPDSSRGFFARAIDQRLWTRVWDGFATRSPLRGPKQFIRISTPVHGPDLEPEDRLLRSFLDEWLNRVDYQAEVEFWQAGIRS